MSIQVKTLSGGYGDTLVCSNISFSIEKGEVLSIVGPNGSGKTTLIKLILGLLKKNSGEIVINNQSVVKYSTKELAKHLAYVPQQHTVPFSLTVFEMVIMGRTSFIPLFSKPSKKDEQIVFETLEKLGIRHIAHESYDTLSGGQKQMVLIARSLCQQPDILIMDEPTSNLDFHNQTRVIQTIKNLANQGFSVIVTSHNLNQPFQYAHKTLIIKDGKTFAFGKTHSVITKENLSSVYELEMDVIVAKDSKGSNRSFCIPV